MSNTEPVSAADSDAFDAIAIAAALRDAERDARPLPLITRTHHGLSFAQARAVATARDELRRDDGDRLIGYKLGWTSAEMRTALGIAKPNWGTLWASQVVSDAIDRSRLIHPKVEPELVFRAKRALQSDDGQAGLTPADGDWALGIEIVDPRWPSFDFDWLDNTADNSSAAGVVLGEFSPLDAPALVEVEFSNGDALAHGRGANALEDPRSAVAWLLQTLGAEGFSLAEDAIVFTGGLTAPFDLEPCRTYSLRAVTGDLGPVELDVC